MCAKSSQCFFSAVVCFILLIFIGAGCKTLPGVRETLKALDKARTEETKKVIQENPELKDLDNWCRLIPLPADFNLVAIQLSPQNFLSFYYFSETDFDKADNFFKENFTKDGWESVKSNYNNRVSVYRKNNRLVIIQFGGIGADANYSIDCEQVKTDETIR
jgi:hypothetical protein